MKNKQNSKTYIFVLLLVFLLPFACTSAAEEILSTQTVDPTLAAEEAMPTSTNPQVPIAAEEIEPLQSSSPTPTNFFITSTPALGPRGVEAVQIPEGKFLFLELVVTYDGKGDLPFAFIDRPFYHYDAERNVLQSGHSLSAIGFDSTSLGFLGTSNKRQGAAGSGSSAGLSTLSELPFSSILQVFNGNMKEYSEEMDEVEITLVTVYEDGSVELALGGNTIILTPGVIWSHHVGVQILSERFDGFYEINSEIINHGWLDREIIRANP